MLSITEMLHLLSEMIVLKNSWIKNWVRDLCVWESSLMNLWKLGGISIRSMIEQSQTNSIEQ
jgi:hypothetical protein